MTQLLAAFAIAIASLFISGLANAFAGDANLQKDLTAKRPHHYYPQHYSTDPGYGYTQGTKKKGTSSHTIRGGNKKMP